MIRKEILDLKVSLSGKKYDVIKIHDIDEPEDLAEAFSRKHNLTKEQTLKLEKLIDHQIDILVEKEIHSIRAQSVTNRPRTPNIQATFSRPKQRVPAVKSHFQLMQKKESDILMQFKKEEKFSLIFHNLNPGRDGKISAGTIEKLDMALPIFQVISPIIHEIHAKKQVLMYKEFKVQMEKLMQKLSENEKNIVLDYGSRGSYLGRKS